MGKSCCRYCFATRGLAFFYVLSSFLVVHGPVEVRGQATSSDWVGLPSTFQPNEKIVVSQDLTYALEQHSVYSFQNLTSLEGVKLNSSGDCNKQCSLTENCNIWSWCNFPEGCSASTANVSWVETVPEWLSPPKVISLAFEHCVLQYAPDTTQVGKGNSFKWGIKGSERNITREDVTITTGAPILQNVSLLAPQVAGFSRYFGVDLPGLDIPCDYNSVLKFKHYNASVQAEGVADEDTDLDWEYCWLSGTAEDLLSLCSKNVFCDAIVFFPNGYSRIGGLHLRPSAWIKSASYSNSTINFGSLIYNPAAVLYVKYNAALGATSLSPEKLTAKQVALLLSISSMTPENLGALNMSDVIWQGMAPYVTLSRVKLESAQGSVSIPEGEHRPSQRTAMPGRQLLAEVQNSSITLPATEALFLLELVNTSSVSKAVTAAMTTEFQGRVERLLASHGFPATHATTLMVTGHQPAVHPHRDFPPPPPLPAAPAGLTTNTVSVAANAAAHVHSGPSHGALIGIVTGLCGAALALCLGLFFWYIQRRKRTELKGSSQRDTAGSLVSLRSLTGLSLLSSPGPGYPTSSIVAAERSDSDCAPKSGGSHGRRERKLTEGCGSVKDIRPGLGNKHSGASSSDGGLASHSGGSGLESRGLRQGASHRVSSGLDIGDAASLDHRAKDPVGTMSLLSQTSSRLSSASLVEVFSEDLEIVLNPDGTKRLLGRGAYGEVYLAKWRRHTLVAAKFVLEPDTQPHFWQEIEVLSTLRHPNIVTFIGACLQPGKVCLCTEYHAGGNFAAALKQDRDRSPRALSWNSRGRKLALDVARGVAFLHAQKIIMFDIKSTNVLLDQTGTIAKVCDFGLSKILAGTHTQNTYRGTLPYMAPELCSYGETITNAVDVYSFGVLLHEIVTCSRPNKKVRMRAPRVPDECPQDIVELYQACMAPDAAQRPSMVEVVARLEAANRQSQTSSQNSICHVPAPQEMPVEPLSDAMPMEPLSDAMPSAFEEQGPAKAAGGGSSGWVGQHQVRPLSGLGHPAETAAPDCSSAAALCHEAVNQVLSSSVPGQGEEGPSKRALANTCLGASPPKRPTSAVATYDTAALANVPPSPFEAACLTEASFPTDPRALAERGALHFGPRVVHPNPREEGQSQ